MAVTTPLTILLTEALDHLTNRWRQAQRETEQYVILSMHCPLRPVLNVLDLDLIYTFDFSGQVRVDGAACTSGVADSVCCDALY